MSLGGEVLTAWYVDSLHHPCAMRIIISFVVAETRRGDGKMGEDPVLVQIGVRRPWAPRDVQIGANTEVIPTRSAFDGRRGRLNVPKVGPNLRSPACA
jgi:hypothetical protein